MISKLGKAGVPDEPGFTDAERLAAEARAKLLLMEMQLDWRDLPEKVAAITAALMADSVSTALKQVGAETAAALDLANPRAVEWATNRAAEMVGMRWIDGRLMENPNAEWRIDDGARDAIRGLVVDAEAEGWSNDRLAGEIAKDAFFSDERAEMIARTETAIADVQGNMAAYQVAQEQGIELYKEWITAGDDKVSEDCLANAKQGPIPMSALFVSGASAPPDHPNCRCDVLPIRVQHGVLGED